MMNQTNPYTAFNHMLYKIGLICQITVIWLLLVKPTEDILLSFLPSDVDKTSLIAFLWTRILIEYLPAFHKFKDDIPKLIVHQYYDEMNTKSSVVREVIVIDVLFHKLF